MPEVRQPLFALRASGKIGGHRRGPYHSHTISSVTTLDTKITGLPEALQTTNSGAFSSHRAFISFIGETKSSWDRALLQFNLTSLLGRSFSAAELQHETKSYVGDPPLLTIERITDPSNIVESQVTWIQRATGTDWADPGGDVDVGGPAPAFDITCPVALGVHSHPEFLPLVTDALASRAGWLTFRLRLNDEGPTEDVSTTWWSKESGASHPTLLLTP